MGGLYAFGLAFPFFLRGVFLSAEYWGVVCSAKAWPMALSISSSRKSSGVRVKGVPCRREPSEAPHQYILAQVSKFSATSKLVLACITFSCASLMVFVPVSLQNLRKAAMLKMMGSLVSL